MKDKNNFMKKEYDFLPYKICGVLLIILITVFLFIAIRIDLFNNIA